MSEDLRNQTRWLAKAGFLATAPNLYFRGGMMKCLFAIARDFKARRGQTYDDIEAVRAWLIRQQGCSGKVGVVNVARAFYLFFVAFENIGFSIVPSMRNGNDNLPSVSLAPSKRAKVFVRNPCLVVIAARP